MNLKKSTSIVDQLVGRLIDYFNELKNSEEFKNVNWESISNGLQNLETAGLLSGVGGLYVKGGTIPASFAAGCWIGSAFFGTIGGFDILVGLTGNKGPSEYLPILNSISEAIHNVLGY